MDPDKCLADILALCESVDPFTENGLVDKIKDLHQWLSTGGYKPAAWAGKGVNLEKVPSEEMAAALDSVRAVLKAGTMPVIRSRRPQVIVSADTINGNEDMVVACLAVAWAEDSNPVEAVNKLREELKAAVQEPIGSA